MDEVTLLGVSFANVDALRGTHKSHRLEMDAYAIPPVPDCGSC
jgi:hypothetical protein